MVTQASDPPFYGIFVPLKIPFEKFWWRHCFAVWAPLIKNPSYAWDADHFFGFCLQAFPLAGPPLRVDCLALMGNMRQVSFQRHKDVLQLLILKKRCVDAFSQEVGKIYESSKVEGFK